MSEVAVAMKVYQSALDENQALRDERERLLFDLKKRIWLSHGSRLNHLLYGDDGRMDCNVCFRDYAGATLEQCYEWEIADACTLVAKAALDAERQEGGAMDSETKEFLQQVAKQLEKWAQESLRGGWSTHQRMPQLVLAERIHGFIVRKI